MRVLASGAPAGVDIAAAYGATGVSYANASGATQVIRIVDSISGLNGSAAAFATRGRWTITSGGALVGISAGVLNITGSAGAMTKENATDTVARCETVPIVVPDGQTFELRFDSSNASDTSTTHTFQVLDETPLQPTTVHRTLDVSSGGEAGVDWANVGSPTTTVGLTGTTVWLVDDAITAAKIAANAIGESEFAAASEIATANAAALPQTIRG